MTDLEKVRENRLRRMAARQGLMLRKSRRRDPYALDYGTYQLVDMSTNILIQWEGIAYPGWSLDEVEEWLTRDHDARKA